MKIFQKKQKQSENAQQKPEVKSALLQTYFVSLLCMILCVGMFLGTSYAWFTSEVTNSGNEIYIGILDVGFNKLVNGKPQDLATPEDASAEKVQLFDKNILWEPGYTTLETIQVVNKGDLAFKYALNFTDGQHIVAEGQTAQPEILQAVAESFDVWVYDHQANGGAPTAATYGDLIATGSKWVKAGTLAEILAGKAVLSNMAMPTEAQLAWLAEQEAANKAAQGEENQAEANQGEANQGEAAQVSTPPTHTYTIALHMMENAQITDVMGMKIGLNVKLVAYQQNSESDSFGNSQYDQLVTDVEQLQAALTNGGTVALMTDMDLSQTQLTVPEGKTVVLDLNGKKLTGTVSEIVDKGVSLITNNGTLIINGNGEIAMTFDGVVDNGKAVNAIANRGKLTVNGGKITNTGTGNQIGYAIDNYNGTTLTVNGGEISAAGSSYYDGVRLFCGSSETLVTVNGGKISTIWAQNPSANKATEVKGTVIVNGGEITKVYYENYTTVQVKIVENYTVAVEAYGAGTAAEPATVDGYTVYSFVN